MAKKKGKTGKLLVVGGIALAGVAAYRAGWFGKLMQMFTPQPGGGGTTPAGDGGTDPTTTPASSDLVGIAALLAGVIELFGATREKDVNDGKDEIDDPNDAPLTIVPGQESLQDEIVAAGAGAGGLATAANWAAAAALTIYGVSKVKQQGEHWGEIYSTLTDDQKAQASAIVGVESGKMAIPSTVEQQKNLIQYALDLENEEAYKLLTPAERRLLESYGKAIR